MTQLNSLGDSSDHHGSPAFQVFVWFYLFCGTNETQGLFQVD
jgi:hypothetical protein